MYKWKITLQTLWGYLTPYDKLNGINFVTQQPLFTLQTVCANQEIWSTHHLWSSLHQTKCLLHVKEIAFIPVPLYLVSTFLYHIVYLWRDFWGTSQKHGDKMPIFTHYGISSIKLQNVENIKYTMEPTWFYFRV